MEQLNLIEKSLQSEYIERLKSCKPSYEAYLYLPQQDDIILNDKVHPKETMRYIFEVDQNNYTEFEKIKLASFYIELESYNKKIESHHKKLRIPANFKSSNILRFIQAASYNIQKAIEILNAHLEWKKNTFPLKMTSRAMEILNSGFVYVCGRDCKYRPIIILNADYYFNLKKVYSLKEIQLAIVYFLEFIVENLLIPGQVENWNIICDMGTLNLISIPKDLLDLFKLLQYNYRCRLYVIYILNMNSFLEVIWKITKSLIETTTYNKIKFLTKEKQSVIFNSINPTQIEERFGGKAKNLEKGNLYFPPYMPSNEYKAEDNNQILSQEDYMKLLFAGKIITPSPYILEQFNNINKKSDSIYNFINFS